MLSEGLFYDIVRQALWVAVITSVPILAVALVSGLIVGLFQALTSVQEQTLSLVPKMLAVIGVALLLLAPAIGILRDFCLRVFGQLHSFGLS